MGVIHFFRGSAPSDRSYESSYVERRTFLSWRKKKHTLQVLQVFNSSITVNNNSFSLKLMVISLFKV